MAWYFSRLRRVIADGGEFLLHLEFYQHKKGGSYQLYQTPKQMFPCYTRKGGGCITSIAHSRLLTKALPTTSALQLIGTRRGVVLLTVGATAQRRARHRRRLV